MASQILGKALPPPETDTIEHCSYSTPGAVFYIDDGIDFAVDLNLPDLTVTDEMSDINSVSKNSATQSVSGLSPDAMISTSTDSGLQLDGSSVPLYGVIVVWKAGDVQKIAVNTTTDLEGTRTRLINAARKIYAAEQ